MIRCKPDLERGGGSSLVRVTIRQGVDDGPEDAGDAFRIGAITGRARSVKSKALKTIGKISPEECQRAFDEIRKLHPDALYDQLSDIAAEHLHVTARQLRKHVPNPFR